MITATILDTEFSPIGGRGGRGRGQGRKRVAEGQVTVTASIRMTEAQRSKLDDLGGAPWVRAKIDEERIEK